MTDTEKPTNDFNASRRHYLGLHLQVDGLLLADRLAGIFKVLTDERDVGVHNDAVREVFLLVNVGSALTDADVHRWEFFLQRVAKEILTVGQAEHIGTAEQTQ